MNTLNNPNMWPDGSRGFLAGEGAWQKAIEENRPGLGILLRDHLSRRRWFGGKARKIRMADIAGRIRLDLDETTAYILFIRVDYADGPEETYLLPVTFAAGDKAAAIRRENPSLILAEAGVIDTEGILYDAFWDEAFTRRLLSIILNRRKISAENGALEASTTDRSPESLPSLDEIPAPEVLRAEQSNTSVLFGRTMIMKMFRRLEHGVNPDLEIGRFLTRKARFPNIPGVVGALEYRESGRDPSTLAVLHHFVENRGDAWQYTIDYLHHYYERAAAGAPETGEEFAAERRLSALVEEEAPPEAKNLFGVYLSQAALLGQRTGELHLALASETEDPAFTPEPFSESFKRAESLSLRNQLTQVFRDVRNRLAVVPEGYRRTLERILALEPDIIRRFQAIGDRRLDSMRLRIHGDYHLGQVLYTGRDFMIIDFEGEPARPLEERKSKKSPLRDVAGMIRSLHYASYASLLQRGKATGLPSLKSMKPWRELWYRWNSAYFLRSYLATCKGALFMPGSREEIEILLETYLLQKAVYELGYELNNRPDWIRIPMEGILEIMEPDHTEKKEL